MAYESDHSRAEQIIDKHFKRDGERYYFYSPGINGSLPISAELSFWGSDLLRKRIFVARIFSFVATGVAGVWMLWNGLVEDSMLVGVAALIPAILAGLAAYVVAIRITLMPFQKQLFKYLGWKRRGWRRAIFELGALPKLIPILILAAIFVARIALKYLGWLDWDIDFSGMKETVFIMLSVFCVIYLAIRNYALAYAPPEQTD